MWHHSLMISLFSLSCQPYLPFNWRAPFLWQDSKICICDFCLVPFVLLYFLLYSHCDLHRPQNYTSEHLAQCSFPKTQLDLMPPMVCLFSHNLPCTEWFTCPFCGWNYFDCSWKIMLLDMTIWLQSSSIHFSDLRKIESGPALFQCRKRIHAATHSQVQCTYIQSPHIYVLSCALEMMKAAIIRVMWTQA